MHRGVRESGRKAHAPRERKKRDRSATGREAVSFPPLLSPEAETEALLRSTLDSLSAHIAVLDETGTIIAVNQAWRSFAALSGYVGEDHGIGTNYLTVCETSAPFSPDAARTAKALRAIIAGRSSEYRMEYPCTGPDGARWFQLRVTRPDRAHTRRVVIAHEDITEVKQAQDALARLTARLMMVQDEERRAIARELHDTTAQNLLAATLNVTRLRDRFRNIEEPARLLLTETLELIEQSLQEVRTLSYVLHPPLLDVIGLRSALQWLARGFSERSGIEVEADVDDIGEPLSQEAATALFRVAQEALANVHRHSGSPWARVALHRSGRQVRLEVLDRGHGFSGPQPNEGHEAIQGLGIGISGMRLRVEQLGGRLDIQSGRSGTRVTAIMPIGSRARPKTTAPEPTDSHDAPNPPR
jgi:PAS domain S-box-containing protein